MNDAELANWLREDLPYVRSPWEPIPSFTVEVLDALLALLREAQVALDSTIGALPSHSYPKTLDRVQRLEARLRAVLGEGR